MDDSSKKQDDRVIDSCSFSYQDKNTTDNSLLVKLDKRIPFLGIIMMMVASVALTSGGLFVKLIHSIHAVEIVFIR